MNRAVRLALSATTLFVIGVGPAAAQSAPSGDPSSALQRLVAAFSRSDEQAVLGMVSDDIIFINGPCGGEPGQTCVGKAQLQQAIHAGGPVSVALLDSPVVSGEGGNVVSFRTSEVFELPPQATDAGVRRFVERGTATLNSAGQFTRIGLVADVSDLQTVTLLRLFSQLGPNNNSNPSELVASDGQSLATQAAATQLQFLGLYGNAAPARWVQEHEATLHH